MTIEQNQDIADQLRKFRDTTEQTLDRLRTEHASILASSDLQPNETTDPQEYVESVYRRRQAAETVARLEAEIAYNELELLSAERQIAEVGG